MLYHLQINHAHLFLQRAQKNFMRQENIASPRGTITDSRGAILATNRPFYTLYWTGTGERNFTTHQQELITTLTTLFNLTTQTVAHLKTVEKQCSRLMLAQDISFDQLTQLVEQYPQDKNLFLEKSYRRSYPFKNMACHIVGYLGFDAQTVGKMGLERSCNKALQGQSGKIVKIINSMGRSLEAHTVSSGLAGKTLQTTLDLELQQAAEDIFPAHYEGCCLCMDESGALEVLFSRPTFDPNVFLKPLGVSEWHQLQEKNGFMNRALSACYPPASLFKMATLAAALETGLICPSMRWHCIGHIEYKGRLYHCSNKNGHGLLSTEQALAHSCNIPFFEMAKKLKIDTLADYAHRLGLGVKTGIMLPEKTGLIPTRAWKKRVKKEPWWPGETLSASIGQSYTLVTPLQVAVMINALHTGYRVQPRILYDDPIIQDPLYIKTETRAFLKQCLTSVIKQGTARQLNNLKHFTLSGKTGTAQTCSFERATLSKKHLHHGYFVSHFQYKNEKPRTLMIFIEHAGSSSVATRVAHQFFLKYASLCERRATI